MPWEMSTCETESLYLSGRQKRSLLKPGKSSGMDMQVVRSSEEEDVVVILAVWLSERDWINGRRKETWPNTPVRNVARGERVKLWGTQALMFDIDLFIDEAAENSASKKFSSIT